MPLPSSAPPGYEGGIYRIIPPQRYQELGIDPEDVPLGTLPAEDHPPFLPDRFGGNAYGLGLYEHRLLSTEDARLLEKLDLDDPSQVARHYRRLNEILKRLGLLVRFSAKGRPFYLIPRQMLGQLMVELQSQASEIARFLEHLRSEAAEQKLRVGLVSTDPELLLPELSARMGHLQVVVLDSLGKLGAFKGRMGVVVVVGEPRELARRLLSATGASLGPGQEENLGRFLAGSIYDLLAPGGKLMWLGEAPVEPSRARVRVKFSSQEELKRFLLFTRVYRTRRVYRCPEGLEMVVERFDLHSFLSGVGLYHELAQDLLGGRSLSELSPQEVARLPRAGLPLPRGKLEHLTRAIRRWFSPLMEITRLEPILPEPLRAHWEGRLEVQGQLPMPMVIMEATRRRAPVSLAWLEAQAAWRELAGCSRELLADYKDSFGYVFKVLSILKGLKKGAISWLPGPELNRLRMPFKSAAGHRHLRHITELMRLMPRLQRMEQWLNPAKALGDRTPVLANLEKLALWGLGEGAIDQLYLIITGHSTMARVCFGKEPEATLAPLTDTSRYRDQDEAIETIRLYRMLAFAEAAAAAEGPLRPAQVAELFTLYAKALRVVTSRGKVGWADVVEEEITTGGGVEYKATRRLLKLFDLFEYLSHWPQVLGAGSRLKEALADFDRRRLASIEQVAQLVEEMRRFVELHYGADSGARPYFYRGLLACGFHGTARVLPRLGPEAGFRLLWISVHTSRRRIVNFNPLLQDISNTQALRQFKAALMRLSPQELSPPALEQMARELDEGRRAYLGRSGIMLMQEPRSAALTPRFVDPLSRLATLRSELSALGEAGVEELAPTRLRAIDTALKELGLFLEAQPPHPSLKRMYSAWSRLSRQWEELISSQLVRVQGLGRIMARVVHHCPYTASRLLPQPPAHPMTRRRLAAGTKLSALVEDKWNDFQDMELSYQMARQEFGPVAAGIVGVSRAQFRRLRELTLQLLKRRPQMEQVLGAAVALYEEATPPGTQAQLAPRVVELAALDAQRQQELAFVLAHHDIFRQLTSGEGCLSGLEPLVAQPSQELVEACFVLGVVTTAASQEGLLTEDLMEEFLKLRELVNHLRATGHSATQAHYRSIEDHARRWLALQRYSVEARGAGELEVLARQMELDPARRHEWWPQGLAQAGIERLLRLKGLWSVGAWELALLRLGMPPRFIYRLKGLRSVGLRHFEADLAEARATYRSLRTLPETVQEFILSRLSDPARPVRLAGFSRVARELAPQHQLLLILLGLSAPEAAGLKHPVSVSFLPLASQMPHASARLRKALDHLQPQAMTNPDSASEELLRRGLLATTTAEGKVVEIALAPEPELERRLMAIRQAPSARELKRLYHRELKRLSQGTIAAPDYPQRLEAAFNQRLEELGEELLKRVNQAMAAETDPAKLKRLLEKAWEEGLELPLSEARQQSLKDIYEMNIERIRRQVLRELTRSLDKISSLEELKQLWGLTRQRLRRLRPYLGKDFTMVVAHRFDMAARKLG